MAGMLRIAAATCLLALAACSGQTVQTTGPAATTPGASAMPATATAPAQGGTGTECASFPSFDPLSTAEPPTIKDPELEARMPTTIDGQPVTGLESFNFSQAICMGGQTAYDRFRNTITVQFDLLRLTMATASATVDDENVDLAAFRIPGGDANQIVQVLAQLDAAAQGDTQIVSVDPGSAGGKNVLVVTNDDGTIGYGYVSGDTLFVAEDIDQSQADKIFGAIQ